MNDLQNDVAAEKNKKFCLEIPTVECYFDFDCEHCLPD